MVKEVGGTIMEVKRLASRANNTRAYIVGDPHIVVLVEKLLLSAIGRNFGKK